MNDEKAGPGAVIGLGKMGAAMAQILKIHGLRRRGALQALGLGP